MEFKITNTYVYGLENACRASGNPMRTKIEEANFEKDIKRAKKLSKTNIGEGHDNMLNGILVQFDLYAPLYMWKQLQRYHFLDFISSQSTMHCVTKFDIEEQCNKYVWKELIQKLQEKVEEYNHTKDKETWYEIISNLPSGFILGATMTTNYRQLKTIYKQRKSHKLNEWKDFCKWIETLEYSELITEN